MPNASRPPLTRSIVAAVLLGEVDPEKAQLGEEFNVLPERLALPAEGRVGELLIGEVFERRYEHLLLFTERDHRYPLSGQTISNYVPGSLIVPSELPRGVRLRLREDDVRIEQRVDLALGVIEGFEDGNRILADGGRVRRERSVVDRRAEPER
jgi:hypothetical protein